MGHVTGQNKTDCAIARAVPVPVSSAVRITPCPRHDLSTWQVFTWKAPSAYPAPGVAMVATCALPGAPGTGWINERLIAGTGRKGHDADDVDGEYYEY